MKRMLLTKPILFIMNIRIFHIVMPLLFITVLLPIANSQTLPLTTIEIPSSFNPVGSGARSIGRGGAFIAVADDATAASWNPGGLIQLKRKPELSVVFSGFRRKEHNDFGYPFLEAETNAMFDTSVNYLSIAGSFEWLQRNMSLALTYQHLYDFNRDWTVLFDGQRWDYRQEGRLSALGLSYCIEVFPKMSAGMTFNFWESGLTPNSWKQEYNISSSGIFYGETFEERVHKFEEYHFSGFSMNFGLLYCINRHLTIGAVLKTPFRADIEHEIRRNWDFKYPESPFANTSGTQYESRNETIDMPMSYGIGIAYRFSDFFSIAADVYRTHWNDFVYTDENGMERRPVSGRLIHESDVDATLQVRFGAEYLFLNMDQRYVIPVRCGVFYDPAPAEGNSDDFYGFSLGTGFILIDRFSLDVAYQYRFGNSVGKSYLEHLGFSQRVREHKVYLSMIVYRF